MSDANRSDALAADDLVRGQFVGYRNEPGVAPDSDVEDLLRPAGFIDSWRWTGVPWFLRSGKCLLETVTELLVELKRPPQRCSPTLGRRAAHRTTCGSGSPGSRDRLAARVKRAGEDFVGEQPELLLLEIQRGQEAPYERPLGEAMAGGGALFTREESVEAAWAVVEPVLASHHRSVPYQPDTWGPKPGRQADRPARPLE